MKKLILAVCAALLMTAAPAHAAEFTVTRFDDPLRVPQCTPTDCSLRGALMAAQSNDNGEEIQDRIVLSAGTYQLGAELNMEQLGQDVKNIVIAGAGANKTVIEPVPDGEFRILTVASTGTVTLSDLTVRGGQAGEGNGGNVLVRSAVLLLQRARVTQGQALNGGGIATTDGGGVLISQSLIDNNAAGNGGGGLALQGTALILESTITRNTAGNTGGILMSPQFSGGLGLRGATVAFNQTKSPQAAAGGGINVPSSEGPRQISIQGSIIAGNTRAIPGIAGNIDVAGNCTIAPPVTDLGGNVDDGDTCKLSGLVDTDPRLPTTLDETQQPPTLNLPAGSPAIDVLDCADRVDQRGVPRPQGARCDAGAYEFDPPPATTITGTSAPFTFAASKPDATFECSLDGGPFTPCSPPYDPGAGPGTHTLAVRAIDARGNVGDPVTVTFTVPQPLPQLTPTPTPSATPAPTPVANRIVVVRKTRGTVKVKLKGAKRFIDLGAAQGIPVGSTVDAKRGRVELTSIPKAGGKPEKAVFYAGIFRITQARGITTLTLTEALARCPRRGSAAAAAAKKKPKKRRLWGDGRGAFRISGKYAAATVRGTKWLVKDSCAGTLTRVTRGVVAVRDRVKRRTILVRAKKSYLARPRR